MSNTFWVIERNDIPWGEKQAGVTLYYALRPGVQWDERVDQAIQFSRQTDAYHFHHKILHADPAFRVVEHAYCAPPASAGSEGATVERLIELERILRELVIAHIQRTLTPAMPADGGE